MRLTVFENFPFLSFSIRKSGIQHIYLFKEDGLNSFFINSIDKNINIQENFTFKNKKFIHLRTKMIEFDNIEIRDCLYTRYNFCVTLWKSGSNVLTGDYNFLLITELPNLLLENNIELTKKQIVALNKMFSNFYKYHKLNELFQLDLNYLGRETLNEKSF